MLVIESEVLPEYSIESLYHFSNVIYKTT
jgi:hypothetical protein